CAQTRKASPSVRTSGVTARTASAPTASAVVHVPAPPPDDFALRVRPILAARCQPCHFAGGQMYARLPFDRAETVLALREKLVTRRKDESERRTLRAFLAAPPAAVGKADAS